MRRSLLASLFVLLVLAPIASAQSAQEVLHDALSRYAADMTGVENYTITQSVMGTETMIYAERTEGAAPLDYTFTSYVVTSDGAREIGISEEDGGTMNPYLMLERIAEEARYAGTEDVDGERAHAIAVDNFSKVARDLDLMPEQADAEFDIETVTFYIDTDDHRARKMTMQGTMTRDGRTSPVTVETQFLDYRTVDGFTTPFRTVMEVQGMEGQMDPEERENARRQLEEAEQQMKSMPEAQRTMMERMMGDRLEQLREMLGGEGFTFEMEVTDVKVNAGPPN